MSDIANIESKRGDFSVVWFGMTGLKLSFYCFNIDIKHRLSDFLSTDNRYRCRPPKNYYIWVFFVPSFKPLRPGHTKPIIPYVLTGKKQTPYINTCSKLVTCTILSFV